MGNERPTTSDADLLNDILIAVGGGGTNSTGGTHSIASVDTTYRQLTDGSNPALISDPTQDQTFKLRVFLNNMASGDTVDIRADVESADGVFENTNWNYTNAQTNAEWVDFEVPVYNGFGVRFMVRQTAGTARSLPFRILAAQALV